MSQSPQAVEGVKGPRRSVQFADQLYEEHDGNKGEPSNELAKSDFEHHMLNMMASAPVEGGEDEQNTANEQANQDARRALKRLRTGKFAMEMILNSMGKKNEVPNVESGTKPHEGGGTWKVSVFGGDEAPPLPDEGEEDGDPMSPSGEAGMDSPVSPFECSDEEDELGEIDPSTPPAEQVKSIFGIINPKIKNTNIPSMKSESRLKTSKAREKRRENEMPKTDAVVMKKDGQDLDKRLNEALFEETLFKKALEELNAEFKVASEDHPVDPVRMVLDRLKKGAKSYGFWTLPDDDLTVSAEVVLNRPKGKKGANAIKPAVAKGEKKKKKGLMQKMMEPSSDQAMSRTKWFLRIFYLLCSLGYGVKVLQGEAFNYLGWWLFGARGAACGVMVSTSVLFITMSRSIMTQVYEITGFSPLLHSRELHILSAEHMCFYSLVHVVCHAVATAPALFKYDKDLWNSLLLCAKPDFKPWFPNFQIPACPLEQEFNVWIALSNVISFTGVILCTILAGFFILSTRRVRVRDFTAFHVSHLTLLALWWVFLFLHGTQQWLGAGLPLSLPIIAPFMLLYIVGRVKREFLPECEIYEAYMVTPKLLQVSILGSEPFLKAMKPGMFANLNVREISKWEWHPFSISDVSDPSGRLVTFVILICGDWTEKFAKRCMAAAKPRQTKVTLEGLKGQVPPPLTPAGHKSMSLLRGSSMRPLDLDEFPLIRLDGPHCAPAQSMLSKGVIVSVGAGVGITPFLGSMEAMLQQGGVPDGKEVYFYWIARKASDFLVAKDLLSRLEKEPRVTLKLYITAKPDFEKDLNALLFKHAITKGPGGKEGYFLANIGGNRGSVPMYFGRPNWANEFARIGIPDTRGYEQDEEVNEASATPTVPAIASRATCWVYICGGPTLVGGIENAAKEQKNRKFVIMAEEF